MARFSEYGIVSFTRDDNKFTLRINLYDTINRLHITTKLSNYFQSLNIPAIVASDRKLVICNWEIRR